MKEHRKKICIDAFQTGLIVRLFAYLLAYQLIGWAFFAWCEQINAARMLLGAEANSVGSHFFYSLLALVVVVPPLTFDTIRFAHRLVGPLYRFRKTMQAVAGGQQVALVQLRNGDLLQDFRDDFNAMLKHLEQQGYVLLKTPEPAVILETPPVVGGVVRVSGHSGV